MQKAYDKCECKFIAIKRFKEINKLKGLKSLHIRQTLFGEINSQAANSLNNLGSLYYNIKNLPKAEEFYLNSLQIRQKLFGENHSDVAASFNNLGLLYDNMGDIWKAEEFYLKSFKIKQNLLRLNH